MPAETKTPTLRATTLLTLAASVAFAVLAPAGIVLGAPLARGDEGDPGAARIAKMGIDTQTHAATDEIGAAYFRWEFPRLAAAQLEIGESLVFTLPGARTIELPLVERNWIASGALGLSFADPKLGASAEIVIANGLVHGSVRAEIDGRSERWSLATGVDQAGLAGDYYESILGIDAQSLVTPVDVPTALFEMAGDGGVAGSGCDDNGALIDVLFAFTPGFRALYASTDAMQTAILADLQRMNLAQVNSLSGPRFHSVGFSAVTQPGSGSILTDLQRLALPADGWGDGVHADRDDLRADLVVLYTDSPGDSAAFIGVGNQAAGFSAVGTQGGFALARALATNMGCCNAPGDSTPACAGAFAFSNAFRFTAGSTGYRTLMALPPGAEIPYFSNPSVSFLGVATGSSSANNSRTMSLTSATVAKYRCSTGPDPDCDGDGVLDTVAIDTGLVPDCNRTRIPDSCDIALGISVDLNGDGVPDECPLTDKQFVVPGAVQLDTLGSAVSVSTRAGDPAVLYGFGGPGNDVGASNAGAAWVLPVLAGTPNLSLAQVLRPSDPQQNAFFGRGISVFKRPATTSPAAPARNMACVSAFRWLQTASTGNYPSKGAIYLFEENASGTWVQTVSGTPSTPWRFTPPATGGSGSGAYSLFGYSLALGRNPVETGESIIVGAPGRNNGQGGVYVVRNTAANTPSLHVLRTLTNPTDGDQFGFAVAQAVTVPTTGNSRAAFVAGAPGRLNNTGLVQVFERPASGTSFGTWASPLTLNPQGVTLVAGDRFGAALAMVARPATPAVAPTAIIVVGAPGDDDGRGRVYFWERGTGTGLTTAWSFRGSFQPADAQPGDQFGTSVAVALGATTSDFVITVGAPKADVNVGTTPRVDAGKIYVLRHTPGATGATLSSARAAFAPATGDEFGSAAAAVQGFGAVGTPFNDSAGLNTGMVRITVNP